ncbi:hypothetical protein LPJ57_000443 [Coemansia sp. RSA 486]|nr:hypothetical protein LPJ57_000443 [Coemansia sp. RSA 486]
MDEETEQAVRRHLATTVMSRPFGSLPTSIFPTFSVEIDIQMVAQGIHKARAIETATKQENQDRVLSQLATAVSNGTLDSDLELEIIRTLKRQPELCSKVPAEPAYMQFLLTSCPGIFECLVTLVVGAEKRNAMVQNALVSPLSVARHNALINSVISHASELTVDTLLKYLDVVEATCRLVQKSETRMHNVRSLCRLFYIAISQNKALVELVFIQLSSFCLSFLKVKEAADLYKRLVELRPQAST